MTKREKKPDVLTKAQLKKAKAALVHAIEADEELREATERQRHLGITGEAAEILIAAECSLQLLKDPKNKDFDAFDKEGKRVQIESRRGADGGEPRGSGRIGKISERDYDYVLLGIFGTGFRLVSIHKCSRQKINVALKGKKRRDPSINEFKRLAEQVLLRKGT